MKTCDRNSIRDFLEISAELLPSEHCKRVGWDGVRRSRSPNVSLGPNAAHIHVSKNVPVHWSKAGSNPWQVVLLTLWSSGIRCKHLISGSLCTSLLFYFYRAFSAPDVTARVSLLGQPLHTCCCSSVALGLIKQPPNAQQLMGTAARKGALIRSQATGLIPGTLMRVGVRFLPRADE